MQDQKIGYRKFWVTLTSIFALFILIIMCRIDGVTGAKAIGFVTTSYITLEVVKRGLLK